MRITGYYSFESAHRLHDAGCSNEENAALYGPCQTIHGHTYRLEVTLEGSKLEHGMFLNFEKVDEIVRDHVIKHLDHHMIDDEPYFRSHPSTAEELARWIWGQIEPHFARLAGCRLAEVKVFEGEHFSACVDRSDFEH
ncbi:MAG TPA: 6-carboxytetrahydropterin synthase [Candidatus Latescibacteria bacterium]|nr:6-carboxytetrahydropterin synthase [Candidatus Latescibacterota bacterium]HQE61748.1 6-carboxytetrahydropterin synthase [Candidatus Latescibacterota bacterium]HQK21646.1 6-carboxytetrahydropterin synthase [Candidatus Latescibacterota bacterium]